MRGAPLCVSAGGFWAGILLSSAWPKAFPVALALLLLLGGFAVLPIVLLSSASRMWVAAAALAFCLLGAG